MSGPYGPLAWVLHELSVAMAEADVVMSARLGVSAGDYLAIKHVVSRTEEFGPAELGRVLGMSSGSATSLVDRLEEAGHVVRGPHPTDRRRRVLLVTESTRAVLEASLAPLGSAVDELAAGYDVEQRAAIERFLLAVTDLHRTGGQAHGP